MYSMYMYARKAVDKAADWANSFFEDDISLNFPPEKLPAETFNPHYEIVEQNGSVLIDTLPVSLSVTKKQALEIIICLNSKENYTVARKGGSYVCRSFATPSELKEFTHAMLLLPDNVFIGLALKTGDVPYMPRTRQTLEKGGYEEFFPGPKLENVIYECNATISFTTSASSSPHKLEVLLLETGKASCDKGFSRIPDAPNPRPVDYFPKWVDKRLVQSNFAVNAEVSSNSRSGRSLRHSG